MSTRLRTLLHEAGLGGRYAGYTPNFHTEEFQPKTWWICDGDVKVGLIVLGMGAAELVNFDPIHPLREVAFPRIYHAPTMPGDRITLPKWVGAQSATNTGYELTFDVQPDKVTALYTEAWSNGRTAFTRLTWQIDPDYGYVVLCEAEMHSPEPESVEYCNFLPKGTTDDRPGFARYPYVLWEHPSGKIIRWNQNNMAACTLGAYDQRDRRRIKTGGFIGYFGEADRASVVEILESTPDTTAITCQNMLDEHIMWVPKDVAEYATDASGASICRTLYRLISVPPAVDKALTAIAEPLDLIIDRLEPELAAQQHWDDVDCHQCDGTVKVFNYSTLVSGQVTDFESKLDLNSTSRSAVFKYPDAENAPDAPISVVADCGHSGTHSLRLRVNGDQQVARVFGNSFHVTEGKRSRLSAWVKTDLRDGSANLIAEEYLFTMANVTARHNSVPLTGQSDWQHVVVEFTPGEKAHVVEMVISVTGHGTVWFDDVLLEV